MTRINLTQEILTQEQFIEHIMQMTRLAKKDININTPRPIVNKRSVENILGIDIVD